MTISLPGAVRLRPHKDRFIEVGASSAAAAFTPASIAGLAAWWKADALALSDGAAVASWTDSSGNGKTLTQATGGNQPTFKTAIVNSNPVVRFAGNSAQYLSGADLSALTAGTVFVVMKRNLDPPVNDTTAGAWNLGADALGTHVPYSDGIIYDATGTTARKTTVNPTPSLAAWNVYEVVSAAGAWTNYLNGTQLFTTATNTVGFPASATLGRSGATFNYDGDLAEVVVYNSALNTTNRQLVEAYLKTKYGTP